MTATGHDRRNEVAEQITVKALLDAYGLRYRRGGGRHELESNECPARTDHGSFVFRFNEKKKLWQCLGCATRGDAFGFVAAMEGWDCKADWARVLEQTAQIAGVVPSTVSPQERAQRLAVFRQARADRERAEREAAEREAAAAIARATGYWEALPSRHGAGERYLDRRGVGNVVELHGRVRFDRTDAPGRDHWSSDGAPTLALHDLHGRGISGIVRRRLPDVVAADPRGVKAPSLTGCRGSGTMAHALAEIEPGRDVVVTEGIADTITGLVAWPEAVVLGANGTGPLPTVILESARCVARARGRLFVVPHADERGQGEHAVSAGTKGALAAGLRAGYDLVVVELGNAKDLNDAWCAGWRPT
jgi:hypothetical protein